MGSSWPSSIKKRKASAVFAKKRAQKISKDFDIIHGHFYPEKYDFLGSNSQYITFMRDPVQRILSNYFYLKRKIDRKHPDALIVNQLGFSLEEFANHPDNKNVQAHCLQSQDLKEYQFVGITEHYNESLSALKQQMGIECPFVHSENVNQNAKSEYEVSAESIKVIEQCNQEDIKLYNIALDRLAI